eukprot:198718-Pelagomonas_calceolata.AAC.2
MASACRHIVVAPWPYRYWGLVGMHQERRAHFGRNHECHAFWHLEGYPPDVKEGHIRDMTSHVRQRVLVQSVYARQLGAHNVASLIQSNAACKLQDKTKSQGDRAGLLLYAFRGMEPAMPCKACKMQNEGRRLV